MPPCASAMSNQESRSSNQFSTRSLPGVAPSRKNDNPPDALSAPFNGVYQRNCSQQLGLPDGNTIYTPFFPASKPLYSLIPNEASMNRSSAAITRVADSRTALESRLQDAMRRHKSYRSTCVPSRE